MYGMTTAELSAIQADVDRDEDGLSDLERRLVVNAARAGNVGAVRFLERALANSGATRRETRIVLGDLRRMGPAEEPNDQASDRAFLDLKKFLKGLK